MPLDIIKSAIIIIRNSQFAIRNSQFAIRNSQFAIRNSQFVISTDNYCLINRLFSFFKSSSYDGLFSSLNCVQKAVQND